MTHPTAPPFGLHSHQGQRGAENDDHATWFAVPRPDRGDTVYIAAVADGVTSTTGGAQASRIAVAALEAALREPPDPQETLLEWLTGAIHHANDEILFTAKRQPEWQGMSTTLVVAALAGSKLYVLHLGDSRAYLISSGQLHQLTTDHTWAQAAINAGALSAAEAARHPGRHQLQRYLGGQQRPNVAGGVIDPQTGQMEEYLQVQPGDRILLCTDGIHHRLPPATIQQLLADHSTDLQTSVAQLVNAAIASGELDDITALLFTIPAPALTLPPPLVTHPDSEATVVPPPLNALPITPPVRQPTLTPWLIGLSLLLTGVILYLLVR